MISGSSDFLHQLPHYAQELLHHAVALSGYPLAIQHKKEASRGSVYAVRIGEKHHPFHLIILSGHNPSRHLHNIVSAAIQVTRMWSVPPGERVAPKQVYKTLPPYDCRCVQFQQGAVRAGAPATGSP